MRGPRPLVALSLLLPLSAAGALWSCGGGDASTTTTGTSAGGGAPDAGDAAELDEFPVAPDAGLTASCTLDNGTDPVGLCIQKVVLGAEHLAAFDAVRGLAQSWDSTTFAPDTDASHVVLHDAHDDAAYAASVARYHQSAETYGDTELTGQLDADLIALAPTLTKELTPAPAEYAGELYRDLRDASGGLRYLNQNDLATSVDALAEAYGRAIFDAYYVTLAAGDAGVTDAILGAPSGGATAYAPADVATGALALLDLAVRHATDDPAHAASWQSAAATALDHLHLRARDAGTGMYFSALVTSADPDHDALAPAAPGGPPADALLSDVQARVALALLRAQDLVNNNPMALKSLSAYPFEQRAEEAIAALDAPTPSLWDAVGTGYAEGWVPSTSTLLDDKPTRANALMLAALHRAGLMGNTPFASRTKALRPLLLARMPAHTGLLDVLPDQDGYLRTAPASFDFAGSDAGVAPRARSYFSGAISAAVEGLSEQWYGLPH
jgi:hypothetical protein